MAIFPESILDEVEVSLLQYMPDTVYEGISTPVEVLRRPLRYSDPDRSVGIHPVDWTPDEQGSSFIGQNEPGIARYIFRVMNLVKHTDEEEGRALYVLDAKMIRAILYRDTALRVRLGTLNETILGTIERFKRIGIRNQRFLNNELSGQFVFLATTELYVDTEITTLEEI